MHTGTKGPGKKQDEGGQGCDRVHMCEGGCDLILTSFDLNL